MIQKFINNVIIITCLSFTIMMLYFTLLPAFFVPDLTQRVILQTLSICFVTGIATAILQKINIQHVMISLGVSYLTIWIIVFGMGTLLYQILPFDVPIIIAVSLTIFFIFATCILTFYRKNQVDADKINELLQHQQGEDE